MLKIYFLIHPIPKEKPNLEKLKENIILEGRLTEKAALRIIETGNEFYFN